MGNVAVFPMAENVYTNYVLDFTVAPARISSTLKLKAEEITLGIAKKLDLIGILTVELFLTHKGEWLVNELAPRPHNSGHYTIDACVTTQFEQLVRAICDLPLGDTSVGQPCAMLNILGDSWCQGQPDWNFLLTDSTAKLHLYDKDEARPGRKMGHNDRRWPEGKDLGHAGPGAYWLPGGQGWNRLRHEHHRLEPESYAREGGRVWRNSGRQGNLVSGFRPSVGPRQA